MGLQVGREESRTKFGMYMSGLTVRDLRQVPDLSSVHVDDALQGHSCQTFMPVCMLWAFILPALNQTALLCSVQISEAVQEARLGGEASEKYCWQRKGET